jgi:hypothetical protein
MICAAVDLGPVEPFENYMILIIRSSKVILSKIKIATVNQARALKPLELVCSPMIFLLLISTSMKTKITGRTIPLITWEMNMMEIKGKPGQSTTAAPKNIKRVYKL